MAIVECGGSRFLFLFIQRIFCTVLFFTCSLLYMLNVWMPSTKKTNGTDGFPFSSRPPWSKLEAISAESKKSTSFMVNSKLRLETSLSANQNIVIFSCTAFWDACLFYTSNLRKHAGEGTRLSGSGNSQFLNKVIKARWVSLLKKGSGKRSSFIEVEGLLQIMSWNTSPIAPSSSHEMNF